MPNKLEQLIFYFLFFAIPFQARKILYYPEWYFNEWQAVSFYFTDLILLALFLFWTYRSIQALKFSIFNFQFSISKFLSSNFYLILFLIAAGISVKNSLDFYVGFFLWLKLVEFSLFYFYLKNYAIRKFNFIKILYVLILGGVFQAIIGIGQFIKQGDLGLRFLGESVLGSSMTGIASFFNTAGDKIIRSYGTTPHPNILAAYLFLAIFAIYFIWIYKKLKIIAYCLLLIAYCVTLFGFFFTFSRTIIFLWAAGFFARGLLIVAKGKLREQFWHDPLLKRRLAQIVATTVLVTVAFSLLYWPEVSSRIKVSSQEEAVQLRVFYNKESLGGGLNLFGIGLGDFTTWLAEQNPNLPRHMYQPVHNIYLLIYSEIGILGFALFLLFIAALFYEFIKKTKLKELKHYSFFLVTLSILTIGLFDHFLLTLQQGRFVFWLVLTILSVYDTMELQNGDGATLVSWIRRWR